MECFGRVWHDILCCSGPTERSKCHQLSSSQGVFISKSIALQLASRSLLPQHRSAERTTFYQQGVEQELLHLPPPGEPQQDGGLCGRATLTEMLGWKKEISAAVPASCMQAHQLHDGPFLPHHSSFASYTHGRNFWRQRVPLIWGCVIGHPRSPISNGAAT